MITTTLSRRDGWKEEAAATGFAHAASSWMEGTAAVFTHAEFEILRRACREVDRLHAEMALEASRDERLLRLAGVPEAMHGYVADSSSSPVRLVGRYDFALSEDGIPKLIDANTDSWFGLAQSAAMQWGWIERHLAVGALHSDDDQFNLLDEAVVDWFSRLPSAYPLHFAAPMADPDAALACAWLVNCAIQAGCECRPMDIVSLGVDREGCFVDPVGDSVRILVKQHPWHAMLNEEGAGFLMGSRTRFVDPAWTGLISARALQPVLWEAHRGHPNLVEACFADALEETAGSWIWKPLTGGGLRTVDSGSGQWPDHGIVQLKVPLARAGALPATVSVWTVAGEPKAIGVFVETDGERWFLPHIVSDRFG